MSQLYSISVSFYLSLSMLKFVIVSSKCSRVHIRSNEIFSKILKKSSINDISYELAACFIEMKSIFFLFVKKNQNGQLKKLIF